MSHQKPTEDLEEAAIRQGILPNGMNTHMRCDLNLTMKQALVCGIRAFAEETTKRGELARLVLSSAVILPGTYVDVGLPEASCYPNSNAMQRWGGQIVGFVVTPARWVFEHAWNIGHEGI